MNISTKLNHLKIPGLTEDICNIAKSAGKKILEIYNSDFSISQKNDESPLTTADDASHKIICSSLKELTPEIPLLSEESAEIPFETRRQWQTYWLIDPLDGTREFIKKNGEFTVNIALIHEHKPVLGVIYIPVKDFTYNASRGYGVFKQSGSQDPVPISTRQTDAGNITLAGSRSHGNEIQQRFIKELNNAEIIAIGSSLKFCLVAEGIVDIYPRFGPTSEWDTAAAQCIVEEAGGIVVDLDFKPLAYNSKSSLINPDFLAISDPKFNWQQILNKFKITNK